MESHTVGDVFLDCGFVVADGDAGHADYLMGRGDMVRVLGLVLCYCVVDAEGFFCIVHSHSPISILISALCGSGVSL